MTYIPGDYYLTCARTGFKIRRSDAVVDCDTGLIVKRGWDDAKHPLEQKLTPRKPYVPALVRPEPEDHFLTSNEVTASDL
jgi:hypothetical protein